MGTVIIKLTSKGVARYLEYSTVSDSPATLGMSLKRFKKYYRTNYGEQGMKELPERLARVELKGTSCLDDDLAGVLLCNRAGVDEGHLTQAEIWKHYCEGTT